MERPRLVRRVLAAAGDALGIPSWLGTGLIGVLVLGFGAPNGPAADPENRAILTTARQILSLSAAEAGKGLPVRLRGLVTLYRPDWQLFFVQDNTGGIYLYGGTRPMDFAAGQWVEIEGMTQQGRLSPIVSDQSARRLSPAEIPDRAPQPQPVTLDSFRDTRNDCQWLEFAATARAAHLEAQQIVLEFGSGACRVAFLAPWSPQYSNVTELVRARVAVKGVCTFESDGQRRTARVFANSAGDLRLMAPTVGEPFAIPLQSIGNLRQPAWRTNLDTVVHVRGRITHSAAQGCWYVEDGTGAAGVRTEALPDARVGDELDVVGFVAGDERPVGIEDVTIQRLRRDVPISAAWINARDIHNPELCGRLVSLEGLFLEQSHQPRADRLTLAVSDSIITADLPGSNELPRLGPLKPRSLVQVTGIWLDALPGATNRGPRLLLRAPGDLVVVRLPTWWTPNHILAVVGAFAGTSLLVLLWALSLRHQVARQTEQMRQRLAKEASLQQDLVEASRVAGMAEVATDVLHNVGNVLNSVNVSMTLLYERQRDSACFDFERLATLLMDHRLDLPEFLAHDERGRKIPEYIIKLTERLRLEQQEQREELWVLKQNLDHIKDIVSMQQNYAQVSGFREQVQIAELVEHALRINEAGLNRHMVEVRREYAPVPMLTVDKHKVLQILVNLISNAKYALDGCSSADRRLNVGVGRRGPGHVRITVTDNGIGISTENLTQVFRYGFTTRKNGHGFGLHNGANAAREMGGTLTVVSGGIGQGAAFTLELPVSQTEPPL